MNESSQIHYGFPVRLRHILTSTFLRSFPKPYCHPGTSTQQMVVASLAKSPDTVWIVRPAHGKPKTDTGDVNHGDTIRLEHQETERYLHSHGDRRSPLSRQQEVTAHGADDPNDDWRIEVQDQGKWESGKKVRLVHVITKRTLHSHTGHIHPVFTAGEQEVTCFDGRDDNDLWAAEVIRQFVPTEHTSGHPKGDLGVKAAVNAGVAVRTESSEEIQDKVEFHAKGDARTGKFEFHGGSAGHTQRRSTKSIVVWATVVLSVFLTASFISWLIQHGKSDQVTSAPNHKDKAPPRVKVPSPPEDAEKVVVDASPEQIWQTFDGKTSYQADELIRKLYLGKWLIIELPIVDISASSRPELGDVYVAFHGMPQKSVLHNIYAYFDQSSAPKINYLPKGSPLRLQGKITYVDETWIYLTNCELLPRDPKHAQAPEAASPTERINTSELAIPPTWLKAASAASSENGSVFLQLRSFQMQNDEPVAVLIQLSVQLPQKSEARWDGFILPPRQTLEVGGLQFSVSVLQWESNRLQMAVHCISTPAQ